MKKRINNILKYKTLSRLPQESGFYSGDCPGAAAITILSSLFSSLWGTLRRKAEGGSQKSEIRSRKQEAGKFLGSPDSHFLLSGLNADRSKDAVRFSPDATTADLPVNVGQNRKENKEYRIENAKSGKNIPVLRTSGFNEVSLATKLTGATHLGVQTSVTAIGETAAAPRNALSGIHWICRTIIGETAAAPQNICSSASHPSGKKVQRTETLKENIEYRI